MSHIVKISALAVVVLSLTAMAQTNVGSVSGTITDSSGAIIPRASVTLFNPAKGEKTATISNSIGEYVFPMVRPGTYALTTEVKGFKTVVRENLVIQVAEKIRVNISLEPGELAQKIEVQAESPLLQPDTSSIGTVVSETSISNLPLNGRNVYDLVGLVPGVAPLDNFGSGAIPVGGTGLNQISINGGRNLTNGFSLDDVTNNLMGYNAVGAVPILDSVQEFNVLTNSYSAKYGRSSGGVITAVTKSGTNSFHGTLSEYLRNKALDANNFFANANGQPLAQFQQNQFGGTAGGPIKHDKTFFFGGYEGFRQILGGQTLTTVPTDREKQGDFSQTFAQDGSLKVIYNPFTTAPASSGGFSRVPFAGNVIPSALFDTVSKNLLQYFPEPNVPGDPLTHANNYFASAPTHLNIDRYQLRIDHSFSDRNRLFGRFYYDNQTSTVGNTFHNIADPSGFGNYTTHTIGLSISDTISLTPTTVLNLRYGLIRQPNHATPPSVGFDPAQLGFPQSLVDQFELKMFPRFDIAGYTSMGAQYFSAFDIIPTTHSLAANLSKVIGRHSIEAGMDLQLIQGALFQASWPSGQYTFDPGFTNGPDPSNPNPDAGSGLGSLLLGTTSNGNNYAAYDPHWFFTNHYYSFYFQDDIKVNSKLTLNLGLRWDYESPLTDRYNQLSFVDLKSQIPLTVPQVTVPGVGALPKQPFVGGGVGFPGVNGESNGAWLPKRKNFGPRVGFAYSVDSKTVIRSGYGITYPGTTADNSGNYPTIQGFNPITQSILAPDGFTPIQRSDRGFLLSNPYPSGLLPVAGSSLGLLTSAGNRNVGLKRDDAYAYVQQWNFGVQRELPADMLVEAAYAGSHGVHLSDYSGLNIDALPDQYLSLGNALYNSYPNPFLGILPANSALGGQPTITLQQLLLPYPEFTSVAGGPDHRTSSSYHAFQMKVQKRFSHGLTFLGAYTISKLIDDVSATDGPHNNGGTYQDNNNVRLDRAINLTDRSQYLVMSPVYELPFGAGKRFGSGTPVLRQIIGGWTASAILTFGTGFPLSVTCGVCTFPATRPDLIGDPHKGISGSNEDRLNQWFNTAAFAQNQPFHYGTAPRTLPNLRTPGTANTDISLSKSTRITERFRTEFRSDFFNAFNRPMFGPPDTHYGDTTFGVISSQANQPRIIQFGLKLYW